MHNVMATIARFSMRRGVGMPAVNLTYVNCNETSHCERYAHKYEHTKEHPVNVRPDMWYSPVHFPFTTYFILASSLDLSIIFTLSL